MRHLLFSLIVSLACMSAVAAEAPADLLEMSEAIQEGTIDVGKQYDMHKRNGRFHLIHSENIGMECESCHVSESFAKDFMVVNRDNELLKAQGEGKGSKAEVLDRAVCLGCHKQGGIATPWYGTAAQ